MSQQKSKTICGVFCIGIKVWSKLGNGGFDAINHHFDDDIRVVVLDRMFNLWVRVVMRFIHVVSVFIFYYVFFVKWQIHLKVF